MSYQAIASVDDPDAPGHSGVEDARDDELERGAASGPTAAAPTASNTTAGAAAHKPAAATGPSIAPAAAAVAAPAIDPQRQLPLTLIPVGGTNRTIVADSEWTVRQLKVAAFADEMKANKNVRFIFAGQLLPDAATLRAANVKPNAFIHVSIADFKPPTPSSAAGAARAVAGGGAAAHEDAGAVAAEWGLDNAGLAGARLQALEFEHQRMVQQAHEGSAADYVFGFVIGLAFGIFAFVLLLFVRNIPRKRRLGIIAGVGLYFFARLMINADQSQLHAANGTGTGSGVGNGGGGGGGGNGSGADNGGVGTSADGGASSVAAGDSFAARRAARRRNERARNGGGDAGSAGGSSGDRETANGGGAGADKHSKSTADARRASGSTSPAQYRVVLKLDQAPSDVVDLSGLLGNT